ncbi:MAG: HK97 gp10 family phage protein [Rhodospirillales bacterium]
MGPVKFNVSGLREVETALTRLGPELAEQVGDTAVRAMSKPIIEEAKHRAPRDTGDYATKGIGYAKDKADSRDGRRAGKVGATGAGRFIAHLLEFGTSKAAAKPHFRPALDSRANDAIRAGAEALARGLKNVARRLATGKKVRSIR